MFERPTHAPVRRYLPGGRAHFASTLRGIRLPAEAPPRTVVRREPWQWDCGERLNSRPPHVRPGKDLLMRTVLVKGSDERRRIVREGGRAITSNDTAAL